MAAVALALEGIEALPQFFALPFLRRAFSGRVLDAARRDPPGCMTGAAA